MEGKVNILYVDDEALNLMLFKRMFMNKYNVHTAESGVDGLSFLHDNPNFDVVISDMRMPKMNGIEFITKAKELYPNILFYILTGFEITPEIQHSLDSGLIIEYFKKPFDMKAIDNAISNRFQKK